MTTSLEIFGLRRSTDWVTPNSQSFRPPSWPPPNDWVVSEDRDGKILSRWGDSVWDISPWAGFSMKLDFGDGLDSRARRSEPIDSKNAYLLRLIVTWRIWGIKACHNARSFRSVFILLRRLIVFCSKNKIAASELTHFPILLEKLSNIIPATEYSKAILELHRIWDARAHLGFFIASPEDIKRLTTVIPSHDTEQTAYIPPRIWAYQVERLKLCIDDYLSNKQAVEDCFNFCVDAYIYNFGSLEPCINKKAKFRHHRVPFGTQFRSGSRSDCKYHGVFGITAERYGIAQLIKRWITEPIKGISMVSLSSYLSLVQSAGLAYIANFTLQRITEASSLRTDCLIWEFDEKLGRIPIICGETTKTDPDSDARWPTSPSVEAAVEAMTSIARMRMRCASADVNINPTEADKINPYLYNPCTEPWSGSYKIPYSLKVNTGAYTAIYRRYELLFDKEKLRITEEDLRIARMLTPNLSEKFAVGSVWPLAWHQLRRTGVVNMFSSGLLSDSSMQFQMKHASRLMPLYYGRGYTKLMLNEEVERVIVTAMYEAMGNKLRVAVEDRFVSPLGNERKEIILINLVSDKDVKTLAEAARSGQIFFRETRVGACTHRGTCPYGGIETISRCTGGDGNTPCADALYDREKAPEIEKELSLIDQELAITEISSPRYRALMVERIGLENFLNVVRN